MARMEFSGVNEMMDELFRESERLERKATEMLGEAGKAGVKAWQESIRKHGYAPPGKSGRATGELLRSVRATAPKKHGEVYECQIYPQGRDSKKQRLAEIAFVLHYGKSGYTGSGFVHDAEDEMDRTVYQIMADVWERD